MMNGPSSSLNGTVTQSAVSTTARPPTSLGSTAPPAASLRARMRVLSVAAVTAPRLQSACELPQHLQQRRMLKWRDARTRVELKKSLEETAMVHRAATEGGVSEGVVTEVSSARHLEGLERWQQGDLELYSKENLRKRYRLRLHPDILDELQLYWVTLVRSAFFVRTLPATNETVLLRQDYVRFARKIYKAMIEVYDEVEATASANEDWDRDCKGEPHLKRERFGDAMFEMADVWTETMAAAEYVEFLHTLFEQLSFGTPPDTFFWRDDKQIEFGGYEVRPEPKAPPPKTKRRSSSSSSSRSGNPATPRAAITIALAAEAALGAWPSNAGGEPPPARAAGKPAETVVVAPGRDMWTTRPAAHRQPGRLSLVNATWTSNACGDAVAVDNGGAGQQQQPRRQGAPALLPGITGDGSPGPGAWDQAPPSAPFECQVCRKLWPSMLALRAHHAAAHQAQALHWRFNAAAAAPPTAVAATRPKDDQKAVVSLMGRYAQRP